MTKEISTSQKRCSIHTIVSPLLLYLKKKKKTMQHPPASLAPGRFRSVEAAKTQQVKAVPGIK